MSEVFSVFEGLPYLLRSAIVVTVFTGVFTIALFVGVIVVRILFEIAGILLLFLANGARGVVGGLFDSESKVHSPLKFQFRLLLLLVPPVIFVTLYILLATLLLAIFSGMEKLAALMYRYYSKHVELETVSWHERNVWLTVLFVPFGLLLFLGVVLMLLAGVCVAMSKLVYQLTIEQLLKLVRYMRMFLRWMIERIVDLIDLVRDFTLSLIDAVRRLTLDMIAKIGRVIP